MDRSIYRKTNISELKNLLNKELVIFKAIDGNNIIDITNSNIVFNDTIIDTLKIKKSKKLNL